MKNINIKRLSLLSLLLALHIIISSFYIPIFDNSRIMFSFIIKMLVGIIVSPITGIVFGFVADIIGHIVIPSGAFFIGYSITSMLSCLIFSLLLYNKRISYLSLITSKLLVNVLCNVLLNSYWSYILYSKGYMYYLIQSLFKNIILFPIEILLIVSLFKLLLPLLNKYNILKQKDIKII